MQRSMQDKTLAATLTFLRHGEASNSVFEDLKRPLTYRGCLQAKERAHSFTTSTPFDLVFISPALRAQETARNIVETLSYAPCIIEIEELYLPSNKDEREEVEQLLEDGSSLEHTHAYKALDAMIKHVKTLKAKNVLIVAHGNTINSMGLILKPGAKELLSASFGCCEGYIYSSITTKIRWMRS